ncbi:MAG: S8 family peptidase, partial [Elusimicrobiota bacterium]
MKKIKNFLIIIFSFFGMSAAVAILPASRAYSMEITTYSVGRRQAEAVKGQLLVKFKKGVSQERRKKTINMRGGKKIKELKHSGVVKIELPHHVMEKAMHEFGRDPDVEFAEPNFIYRTQEKKHLYERFLINGQEKQQKLLRRQFEKMEDEMSKDEEIPSKSEVLKSYEPAYGMPHPEMTLSSNSLPPAYDNIQEIEDRQWGLARIRAPEAWEFETGEGEAVIAVIDTGIKLDHPDLVDNIWENPHEIENGEDTSDSGYIDDIHGWDFVNDDNDPNPLASFESHGSHVAGIAAASGSNNTAGVALGNSIMSLRALDEIGRGTLDDIAEAIYYAADNGAHIINMSLGGSDSEIMEIALNYAFDQGLVLIAAAGNEDSGMMLYPAGYENVIAVGATDIDDSRASFSNYGEGLDLVAPGVDILSTIPPQEYGSYSGTSMAAPFAAGLASL